MEEATQGAVSILVTETGGIRVSLLAGDADIYERSATLADRLKDTIAGIRECVQGDAGERREPSKPA